MKDPAQDITIRARLRPIEDQHDAVDVSVQERPYRLHLASDDRVAAPVIASGWIEATALRVHQASGGGRFIEPIEGAPRIVAGTVTSIDRSSGSAVIHSAFPMMVHFEDPEDVNRIETGMLLNFHVRSGARWHTTG